MPLNAKNITSFLQGSTVQSPDSSHSHRELTIVPTGISLYTISLSVLGKSLHNGRGHKVLFSEIRTFFFNLLIIF